MMGNCHVRFLGEGGRATCSPLPDQKDNRSVEYKAASGWKLEPGGEHLTQHPRLRHWPGETRGPALHSDPLFPGKHLVFSL
jgi:hypothetical protein